MSTPIVIVIGVAVVGLAFGLVCDIRWGRKARKQELAPARPPSAPVATLPPPTNVSGNGHDVAPWAAPSATVPPVGLPVNLPPPPPPMSG